MFKQTYLESVSIGIEETTILATAEDVKLNTCFLTQIVVDTNLGDLTILQWGQVYAIPTSCQLRKFDGLAEIQIFCIFATIWNFWSYHGECIYIQHKMAVCQYSDICCIDSIELITILIPCHIDHASCDRIHAVVIAINSHCTINSYQSRT